MSDHEHVRLFEVDPDLGRLLTPEDRAEAAELRLPVARAARGVFDIERLITTSGAFGAIVLDGVLLQSLQIADQVGLRLLGPGDVIMPDQDAGSTLRVSATIRTDAPSGFALLDRHTLIAMRRWPRLATGLLARMAQQTERVADQLVICQLPRVEDRILAIMWQLAEIWGYVTPIGTVIPLTLTHETLGGLVGARRSTVTLALGRLSEQGALIRSGEEWLLLEDPPAPHGAAAPFVAPPRLEPRLSLSDPPPASRVEEDRAMLRALIARLREDHQRRLGEQDDRLRRLRSARARRK